MPRTKAVTETALLKAWVPLPLKARLYLLLNSEIEGRIPLGKISQFIAERLREHFEWEELDLGLHGGPQGYFVRGPKDMISWLRSNLRDPQVAADPRAPNAKP